MENNKNRNYAQEDRNYTDAQNTADFEKSKLNDDPNQERDIDSYLNSDNDEDGDWRTGENEKNNADQNNPNRSQPAYDPDENFEEVSDMDDADLESDSDDADLEDENDNHEVFDESILDDDDDDDEDDDELEDDETDQNSDFGNEESYSSI